MSDTRYSGLLRSLAKDYADRVISQAQYRARRRILLKELDEEYNGGEDLVCGPGGMPNGTGRG